MALLKQHFIEGVPADKLCRENKVPSAQFESWKSKFFELGKYVFDNAKIYRDEVKTDFFNRLTDADKGIVKITKENSWLVPLAGRKLQLRWSFAGSKYQRSTGETRKAAVKERDKLEVIAQWWFENKDNLDAPELLKSSFGADIETFIRMKNANCKQISQDKTRTMLKHFRRCTGVDSVSRINEEVFLNAMDKFRLREDGKRALKDKSFRDKLVQVKAFLEYCHHQNKMVSNPAWNYELPSIPLKGTKTIDDLWSCEELKTICQVLDTAHERLLKANYAKRPLKDSFILNILYFTGIDPGDFITIQKQHLRKVDNKNIRISKSRAKSKNTTQDTQVIDLQIPKYVRKDFLKFYAKANKQTDYIFPICENEYDSEGVPDKSKFTNNLGCRVRRAWESIEEAPKDLKSIRHTFICTLKVLDFPNDEIRKMVGHSPRSRILEEVYDHLVSKPIDIQLKETLLGDIWDEQLW